jgi:hypothetical protein
MNRTIASGIFLQAANVLFYAQSSGLAITLWVCAGIIVFCILLCWQELGLSVPINLVHRNGVMVEESTPSNGGDKNYVRTLRTMQSSRDRSDPIGVPAGVDLQTPSTSYHLHFRCGIRHLRESGR